jgi:fructose transport system substrate-binding protein
MSHSPLHLPRRSRARMTLAVVAASALASAALAGCSSDDEASAGGVAVTLITKDSINPFFVSMQEGAKEAAKSEDVDLTIAAGKEDGDEEGQIQAIENAVAQGQDGILITPNGPGVNSAIASARDAGLYVIALDTPPDPADTVDITFATDNFKAGELIGQWTATQLGGKKATIALLDLFNDKVVSVDYNRDQGFLTGMGIDTGDVQKNGDEDASGSYSGGDYEIVCNEPTNGAEDGGRTAMENCLNKNDEINVVYTINEPAAYGADAALEAAGLSADDVLIVSVDGGCQGVDAVGSGVIDGTSQQYPLVMAEMGVKAIKQIASGGDKPQVSDGLDFFNTGVKLVTDQPAGGLESIDSAAASEICWG